MNWKFFENYKNPNIKNSQIVQGHVDHLTEIEWWKFLSLEKDADAIGHKRRVHTSIHPLLLLEDGYWKKKVIKVGNHKKMRINKINRALGNTKIQRYMVKCTRNKWKKNTFMEVLTRSVMSKWIMKHSSTERDSIRRWFNKKKRSQMKCYNNSLTNNMKQQAMKHAKKLFERKKERIILY